MRNDITIKLSVGVVVALVVTIFAYCLASLLYPGKEMVKRGYMVDMINKRSVQKIVLSDMNGVAVGDLPDINSTKDKVDIASMIKKADISAGMRIFKKCAACHIAKKGGGNKIGPNLFGVINRKKASIANFAYSDAMKDKGGKWDYESLNQFLTEPRNYVVGTKMSFVGLKKDKDRANVIAYLESLQ